MIAVAAVIEKVAVDEVLEEVKLEPTLQVQVRHGRPLDLRSMGLKNEQ